MLRISKDIYERCLPDHDKRKSLSLHIWVKHNFPASVIANYSHYKLSKLCGLNQRTVKKYINILFEMGLVEWVGKKQVNLKFNRLRDDNYRTDVRLDKIDFSTPKTIERGLQALFIVQVQKKKDFLKQQFIQATQPDKKTPLKKVKKSIRYIKERGIEKFQDNGISFKYLCEKLKSGKNTISEIINYGIELKLFNRHNNVIQMRIIGAKGLPSYGCHTFSTKDNVYVVLANTYTLI